MFFILNVLEKSGTDTLDQVTTQVTVILLHTHIHDDHTRPSLEGLAINP